MVNGYGEMNYLTELRDTHIRLSNIAASQSPVSVGDRRVPQKEKSCLAVMGGSEETRLSFCLERASCADPFSCYIYPLKVHYDMVSMCQQSNLSSGET